MRAHKSGAGEILRAIYDMIGRSSEIFTMARRVLNLLRVEDSTGTGLIGQPQLPSNAHMGDEKAQRLDDALSSLVDTLIPAFPDEDEAATDERHDDALDLARSILDGQVRS